MIKAGGAYVLDSAQTCTLGLVGRKGKEFFSRRGYNVMFEDVGIFQKLSFENARAIAHTATKAFLEGEVDRVMLVYNEFRSVMTQRVVVDQLLPIADARTSMRGRAGRDGGDRGAGRLPLRAGAAGDLQPAAAALRRGSGLPRAARVERRVLCGADDGDGHRDKNSAEMIDALTLYMNKVRQAAITREIIEVVSGAEAL